MKRILLLIFFTTITYVKEIYPEIYCGNYINTNAKQMQKDAEYSYKVIGSVNGTWGYDIFKNQKLFIHQINKPSVTGNEGFKTKSDAEKVALLVIDKLKNGEMPPSVTKEELNKLKVL
jgi:hypothetical protein